MSSTIEVLTLEADGNAVRALHDTLRRHNRAFRVTPATNPDAALAILVAAGILGYQMHVTHDFWRRSMGER